LVSPEGKLSQMNATARAIFEVGPEVVGKPYRDTLDNETIIEFFDKGTQGFDVPAIELTHTSGHAERVFTVQGAAVRNEEGRNLGFVSILNDVTEQKNLDKMKSSFVAMASHELRTPLTAIKGFTSTLLMDDTFTREEEREFLQIIEHECDRLRRLIDDLLNTARIEAG